jgi:ABC-type bacteriocin/lantibiotic exporter with double-glycine peptidase domain
MKYVSVILGLIAVILFVLAYLNMDFVYVILASAVLLMAVFTYVASVIVYYYNREMEWDQALVQEQGLTIVTCKACSKKNVLEDKYCKYCGEVLDNEL